METLLPEIPDILKEGPFSLNFEKFQKGRPFSLIFQTFYDISSSIPKIQPVRSLTPKTKTDRSLNFKTMPTKGGPPSNSNSEHLKGKTLLTEILEIYPTHWILKIFQRGTILSYFPDTLERRQTLIYRPRKPRKFGHWTLKFRQTGHWTLKPSQQGGNPSHSISKFLNEGSVLTEIREISKRGPSESILKFFKEETPF